jgi:glycosyltransferase involved in cell wall biosynthesis
VSYNSRKFIDKTIESVIGQTYQDLEYVIVDGGSTDGTVDIIKRHAAADPRIVWCSEADRGIADAMNKGVALSSGEVISHLNSDDCYKKPDVISRVAAIFSEKPDVQWLTGGFDFVSEEGEFIREIRARRYSFKRLIHGNILLHPATFIRRSFFDSAGGFDPSLRYCMDYDLFLRLASITPPFVMDEQLACFRVHAGSRSLSESERAYAEELQVRLNFLRDRGEGTACYKLEYQIKRLLNRLFYKGLFRDSLKKG